MSKVTQRDEVRDKRLLSEYERVRSGKINMLNLSLQFGITASRIYQILDHYGVKRIIKVSKSGRS